LKVNVGNGKNRKTEKRAIKELGSLWFCWAG